MRRASRSLELVPGRFQRIDEGQPFLVVVDYAHTDDALRNLIATARELSPSARIITVFGAGGERDRTKRPLMGEAAGSLSDLVVLTSDNPRSEDPLLIINDVVVGLQKVNAKYRVEPDREQALAMALDEARPGDIVLLAGKGHETYQVLRDGTIEFDDRERARAILRRKGYTEDAGGQIARADDAKPPGDAMRWTVDQLADALGVARPSGLDPLAGVAGVSIDSRTVQPGELFVAIRGPRHDGHDFVAGALDRGAAAGVVARDRFEEYPREIQAKLFAVDDHARGAAATGLPGVRDLAAGESRGELRGGRRVGREDHHKRDSGGASGRAVPRAEDGRESEQRVRAAADAAED